MNGNDYIETAERLDKPIEEVTAEDIICRKYDFLDLPVDKFNDYVEELIK